MRCTTLATVLSVLSLPSLWPWFLHFWSSPYTCYTVWPTAWSRRSHIQSALAFCSSSRFRSQHACRFSQEPKGMRSLPPLLRKSEIENYSVWKEYMLTHHRYCAVLVVFLTNVGGGGGISRPSINLWGVGGVLFPVHIDLLPGETWVESLCLRQAW